MLKSALIAINVIGLVLFPFLYMENVSIEHSIPSEMEPGTEQIVDITINKGTISGPARLKLDFSGASGLSAEEVESSGASFTFKDGAALFIWYSVPASETINLKYKLKADASAGGSQTVAGTFSYVDGEERKKLPIPSAIVEVKGADVAVTPDPDPTADEDSIIFIDSNQPDPVEEKAIVVTSNREIVADGDDFLVTVTINKEDGTGFARLKETCPEGYTAKSVSSSGAVFSFSNNTAKYLWSSVKKNTPIVVSYRLIPKPETVSGTYAIEGEFSAEFTVVDDVAKAHNVSMSSFQYEGGEIAAVDPVDPVDPDPVDPVDPDPVDPVDPDPVDPVDPDPVDPVDPDPVDPVDPDPVDPVDPDPVDPVDPDPVDPVDPDPVDPVDPDPVDPIDPVDQDPVVINTGVEFKVQILASHKTVDQKYIKKRYGVTDKVALESHEGWVKYTVGSYSKYGRARDKREDLSPYDLPGPFVTAYNAGDRISVQEALMVVNQSWIK